nr:hypothetical protein [Bacteroidota bacterium]
ENVFRDYRVKTDGFSVRCLKDENMPPEPPTSPNPENGAENQPIEIDLSWTCTDPEGDPLTYDIYFGIEAAPPQVATGILDTFYTPATLAYSTIYHWKIIAHDNQGNSTEGGIWSFSTMTDPNWQCGDTIVDIRDEQKYATVQIGEQCWMAENLNMGTRINGESNQTDNSMIEKYCYGDDPANCTTYGGLYQWNEIMQYTTTQGVQGICMEGWHLPTDNEWKILEGTVDSQYPVGDPEWNDTGYRGLDAGGNLKETGTTHWYSSNTGATNSSGFTALPGGNRNTSWSFDSVGYRGYWWSSSQRDASIVWYRRLSYGGVLVGRFSYNKFYGFSARCLKD